MISLINTICKALPSSLLSSKIRHTFLYKLLHQLRSPQMYKPLAFYFPCGSLLPKPVLLDKDQYDVEENIAHLMTLARIALEKGDVEKAEAILEMGIKISDEYQSYIAMPYIYDILASIAFARGNLKKAELLLVNIIEKLVQLGTLEDDGQMIDFKLRLARIYSSYDEAELAEIGFKTCLSQLESKILKGDTGTKTGVLYVNILFWYGLHKLKTGDYKKSKQLVDLAYNYSQKIRGLTAYQEMVILYTLSELNMNLRNYEVALQNIQGAILLGKGIGSTDLPKFYLKLAKIYSGMGTREKSKEYLREAHNLAELFNDREVFDEAEQMLTEITN